MKRHQKRVWGGRGGEVTKIEARGKVLGDEVTEIRKEKINSESQETI